LSTPSAAEVERQADRVHGSGLSARLYDPFLWWGEKSGLSKKRDRLLEYASGEVLEIGAGTGLNLAHYPAGLERLVVSEPEQHKAELLLKKAGELDLDAEFVRASAEALPFEDDSFDTVVATLVFCTVGEPEAAIAEVKRVLRPGGSWLLIEHIRSDRPAIGRIQDRIARPWASVADGCQCNRRTIELIEAGGFEVELKSVADKALMPPIARPIVAGVARPRGS
jgi:SAM-dependent methyltransferase